MPSSALIFTVLIAVKWRASLWQSRTVAAEDERAMARESRHARKTRKRRQRQRKRSRAGRRWPDERLLKLRLRTSSCRCAAPGWRPACASSTPKWRRRGSAGPAARLDFQRMVQPGRHAGHRVSVLSGASAADAARAQDDHRRRGRHPRRMHAHPAPRSRPCAAALLCAAPPAAAGGACSAVRRPAIRAIIGPIRRAGISSSICGCGTRKAIPMRISPRRSRSG